MRPKKPRDSERSDRRGVGNPSPVPHRGCHAVTGGDCLKSIITTSEDWKFVVAPAVGYGLFCSRRDFSDSLGGGIRVTKEGDAIFAPPSFVVPVGHDPTTPWLWVRCSNQLSYGTGCRQTRFDGRHVKVTKLFEKDKTLWISLQNLRQHVFVKCKKNDLHHFKFAIYWCSGWFYVFNYTQVSHLRNTALLHCLQWK